MSALYQAVSEGQVIKHTRFGLVRRLTGDKTNFMLVWPSTFRAKIKPYVDPNTFVTSACKVLSNNVLHIRLTQTGKWWIVPRIIDFKVS